MSPCSLKQQFGCPVAAHCLNANVLVGQCACGCCAQHFVLRSSVSQCHGLRVSQCHNDSGCLIATSASVDRGPARCVGPGLVQVYAHTEFPPWNSCFCFFHSVRACSFLIFIFKRSGGIMIRCVGSVPGDDIRDITVLRKTTRRCMTVSTVNVTPSRNQGK